MTYEAEIRWYDTRPNGDVVVYEEAFQTLQAAIDYIECWAIGRGACRAWINNKEVILRNGRVVDGDGKPVCENPDWADVFAKRPENIPADQDVLSRVRDQLDVIFRPLPTRPTSPAVLLARGDL